jgi:hypothetical protein
MKQLVERGAKAERFERHRKRHRDWRGDPRQLKLPFWKED